MVYNHHGKRNWDFLYCWCFCYVCRMNFNILQLTFTLDLARALKYQERGIIFHPVCFKPSLMLHCSVIHSYSSTTFDTSKPTHDEASPQQQWRDSGWLWLGFTDCVNTSRILWTCGTIWNTAKIYLSRWELLFKIWKQNSSMFVVRSGRSSIIY